jgi:hypothetical protein
VYFTTLSSTLENVVYAHFQILLTEQGDPVSFHIVGVHLLHGVIAKEPLEPLDVGCFGVLPSLGELIPLMLQGGQVLPIPLVIGNFFGEMGPDSFVARDRSTEVQERYFPGRWPASYVPPPELVKIQEFPWFKNLRNRFL